MKKIIIALIFLLPIIALLAMTLSVGIVSAAVVISVDNLYVTYNGVDVSSGVTLILDQDAKFDVQIMPKNANNQNLIWEFDEAQFEMKKENVLHTKKEGTSYVTVKAEDGGSYVSFFVNVISAKLEIMMEKTTFSVGEADFLEINSSSLDMNSLVFASSNDSVLEVKSGRILAKSVGTAEIKLQAKLAAAFNSPNVLTATKKITVTPSKLNYKELTVDNEIINLSSLSGLFVNYWTIDDVKIEESDLDSSSLSLGEHILTAHFMEEEESIKITKASYIDSQKFKFSYLDKLTEKLVENTINVGEIPALYLEVVPVFYKDKDKNFSVSWHLSDSDVPYSSKNSERELALLFMGSGELVINADINNGEYNLSLNYNVYLPVEIFSLSLDETGDKVGIKEERVFPKYTYLRDASGNLVTDETDGYMKTNLFEMKIGYFYPENSLPNFTAQVSDESIIRIYDQESKIILEFLGEGTATVSLSVKDSAFGEIITDSYTFIVKDGVGVSSADEFEMALNKRVNAMVFTSNIGTEIHPQDGTWNHDKNDNTPEVPRSVQYTTYSNMYGNGFTLYPNYDYYYDYSFFLRTRMNGILIENLNLRVKNKTKEGEVLSDLNNYGTIMRICTPDEGGPIKNVTIRFCRFENGLCAITGAEVMDEKEPTVIEGCIFKNFMQSAMNFGFESSPIALVLKNNISYNIQCPTFTFYTYLPDLSKNIYFNLKFEGFFDNYNWREKDNMELIGNLTGDESIDTSIKNLINQKLDSAEYSDLYLKYEGVDYINPLMLIITNDALNTSLGKQYDYMTEMNFERVDPDIGALGIILDKMFKYNKIIVYSYYCNINVKNKVPLPYVLPDSKFVENSEMRRQLREGRNG